jgi:hypothetical protein
MIHPSLKLLALCAVVVGMMAFAASEAHAETDAKWLILDPYYGLLDDGHFLAWVEGELENDFASLLTEVLGIEVEILCTASELIGMHLGWKGSLTSGGTAYSTGCSVDLDGSASSACEPHSVGDPVGTIESNEGKGLLTLVLSGVAGTVVVAREGTTLANVNMGSECPIGENLPIRGTLVIEDPGLTTHSVVHLINENTTHSHLWVLNDTVEHAAKIDGSAEVLLTDLLNGGHAWAGDPA